MIDYAPYQYFEDQEGMKELAKDMINKNIELAKTLKFELDAQLQDKEVIDWDIQVPGWKLEDPYAKKSLPISNWIKKNIAKG